MTQLELTAPFFWPAFDDHFGLGEELNGVLTLTVQIAEEAFFPTTEGELRHGRCDADIDTNVAGVGLITEGSSIGSTVCK